MLVISSIASRAAAARNASLSAARPRLSSQGIAWSLGNEVPVGARHSGARRSSAMRPSQRLTSGLCGDHRLRGGVLVADVADSQGDQCSGKRNERIEIEGRVIAQPGANEQPTDDRGR